MMRTKIHPCSLAILGSLSLLALACRNAARPTAVEGAPLYKRNGCASCHGQTGHGDGPIADTLVPHPRDFRDTSAFKYGTDVTAIAATLARGIANGDTGAPSVGHPEHERRSMPRFDHLTEHERESLALFVISLRESPLERTTP